MLLELNSLKTNLFQNKQVDADVAAQIPSNNQTWEQALGNKLIHSMDINGGESFFDNIFKLDGAAGMNESQTNDNIMTVKKGDCLWNIAKELKKNNTSYKDQSIPQIIETLQSANDIEDANKIYTGQKLIIPAKASEETNNSSTTSLSSNDDSSDSKTQQNSSGTNLLETIFEGIKKAFSFSWFGNADTTTQTNSQTTKSSQNSTTGTDTIIEDQSAYLTSNNGYDFDSLSGNSPVKDINDSMNDFYADFNKTFGSSKSIEDELKETNDYLSKIYAQSGSMVSGDAYDQVHALNDSMNKFYEKFYKNAEVVTSSSSSENTETSNNTIPEDMMAQENEPVFI